MNKKLGSLLLTAILILSSSIGVFAQETQNKEELYQEYQEIVKNVVNETGKSLQLKAFEEMDDDDWVSPEMFEQAAYDMSNASIRSVGSASKSVTGDFFGKSFTVVIYGDFMTQYDSSTQRQLFLSRESITSACSTGGMEWTQIDYAVSKKDGRRTYSVDVSGKLEYLGLYANYVFNVEFYCNAQGAIS